MNTTTDSVAHGFTVSSSSSSSSTLNETKLDVKHDVKSQLKSTRGRFSIPSFGKSRSKPVATPSSSTSSLSDDGSEIASVATRFVIDSSRLSSSYSSSSRRKPGVGKLYRPAKICRRENKEVAALPHQLQILFERGATPLLRDYDLLNRKLGDGAMGSVYLVQRRSDKKLFAAKMHTKDHSRLTRAQYLQRIADEVIIASTMFHDHIIPTVDFVSNGGKYMTIMEYCPSDLFDVISSNTLNTQQIDNYFVQLLLGVQHLHHQGIAHRDLKLENMCVDKMGNLKVIDFGCATQFRPAMSSAPSLSKGVFGSDPYIAPEIWSDYHYDAVKADLWSLGVVYVAMQSGRFLWDRAQSDDHRYHSFFSRSTATFTKYKIPSYAHPLLLRLLDPSPSSRISLSEVLEEPWIQEILLSL